MSTDTERVLARKNNFGNYSNRASTNNNTSGDMKINTILQGDTLQVLKTLPDESVDCIITSPPYYGLRDYGVDGQIGLEKTLDEYLSKMLLKVSEEL